MFDSFKKKLNAAISSISTKLAGKKSAEEDEAENAEKKPEPKEEFAPKAKEKQAAKASVSKTEKAEKIQKAAKAPKQQKQKQTPVAREKSDDSKQIQSVSEPEPVPGKLKKIPDETGRAKAESKEAATAKKSEKTGNAEKEEKPEKEEKAGFFSRLTRAITETKIAPEALDSALWDLELALLENNVASDVASKICSDIKSQLSGKSVKRGDIEKIIKNSIISGVREELNQEPVDIENAISAAKKEKRPCVIAFVGFNGSGKTTNIAKLGHYLQNKGYSCVFAAADSFRVAAIEQLEEHGRRLGIPVIKHKYGADPAAVIFDAVAHAKAKGIDIVLADTAGRVHTDRNLVDELKKIVRVNKPDLKFLVVEAIAGNDVVEQAKIFGEVGLDGVILSKWDIDEKGGAALSVTHTLKKPIVFLGTGQNYDDFEEFDIEKVMENIV